MFLASSVILGISVAILFIYRRFFAHQFFKSLDIPGPEPNWLLGNLGAFVNGRRRHLVLPEWTKKYGKVYGYYEGAMPVLVVSDIATVKDMCIRQFSSFHSRKILVVQPDPDTTSEALHLVFARGHNWKRMRTIANPFFTAAKLQQIGKVINRRLVDFLRLMEENSQMHTEGFDIAACYEWLTFDVIAEVGLGLDLETLKTQSRNSEDESNLLFKIVHALIEIPTAIIIPMVLTEISGLLRHWANVAGKKFGLGLVGLLEKFDRIIESVIRNKKSQACSSSDLLQTLLSHENNHSGNNGMTRGEIRKVAFLFTAAGFETPAHSLAFATYLLAKNPRVQQKLYEEILKHFPEDEQTTEISNEAVFSLKYLDWVIKETIRMYPIGVFTTNRQSVEKTQLQSFSIPAGLNIQIDVLSIHYDNDLYGPVDTSLFYPERFSDDYPTNSDRDPAAWLGFGLGPRMCIGMRYALLEMKLVLIHLLRKFKIEATAKTAESLNPRQLMAFAMTTPEEGVVVRLTPRQS